MSAPRATSGIDDLLAHSITYRIATGPHAGEDLIRAAVALNVKSKGR